MKRYVKQIIEERERIVRYLNEIDGIIVYPTIANFVLVRFKEASALDVFEKLLKRGIVVRDVSELPKLGNCLRFAFRTPQEDDLLLEALKHILS
jgi:histidinol-phosphate aminotransferase